ncbi:hypothetical protein AMTR_s00016p00238330 [Amborella trichopoda]|uniref:Uncharacterized protein n=1 Tax=Amborella trichopoda TaxID=13333 RepID=W1P8Y1_AMBTC|nr:hypothetical protein AMTR_s00016p00238330 [Amborella trichopoda]
MRLLIRGSKFLPLKLARIRELIQIYLWFHWRGSMRIDQPGLVGLCNSVSLLSGRQGVSGILAFQRKQGYETAFCNIERLTVGYDVGHTSSNRATSATVCLGLFTEAEQIAFWQCAFPNHPLKLALPMTSFNTWEWEVDTLLLSFMNLLYSGTIHLCSSRCDVRDSSSTVTGVHERQKETSRIVKTPKRFSLALLKG